MKKNNRNLFFEIAYKCVYLFLFSTISLISYPASYAKASPDELQLIANENISLDMLSKKDVKNIFLGKQKFWNHNDKIIFATLKNNIIHKKFVHYYLHKTTSQYVNYWKKLVFTGRGIYPLSFASEKGLLEYIVKTPGAIGYISNKTIPKDVKVIRIYDATPPAE